jgi:hypothetical protein
LTKINPEQHELRQKLYDEGYCDEDIADRLGVSQPTICNWRNKNNLPIVFQNRKRITNWESKQIQDYLSYERKFRRIKSQKTLALHEKGLISFIMSLKHQLSKVSQLDIEDYIMVHNKMDLSRREELLRTDLVKEFSVPNIPVANLYSFASRIIANRIFYRDGGCVNCKSFVPLHLHHMKGKFNLLDENLVTLCENCHLSIRHGARQYPIK